MPNSMRSALCCLPYLGFAVAVTLTSQLLAAPSSVQRQRARLLVAEGDEKFRKLDYAGALEAYGSAHDIMQVPTTGIEVARTLNALGKLVESRKVADDVQRSVPMVGEPAVFAPARQEAKRMIGELEGRIPKLRIVVSGVAPGAAPSISIDGFDVTLVQQSPVMVNPGAHLVVGSAVGMARTEVAVTAVEGRTLDVALAFQRSAPPAVASSQLLQHPTPSAQGLMLDDFEHEGWSSLEGFWGRGQWVIVSTEGTTLNPPGIAVSADKSQSRVIESTEPLIATLAVNGLQRAAHVRGVVRGTPVAWALLELEFHQDYSPVDLSAYDGVEFDIRSDLAGLVKFKVAGPKTFGPLKRCTLCDNHHTSKPVSLTQQWAHHVYRFSDLHQELGWGEPVGALDPREVVAVQWYTGAGPLDLWLDNVRLVPKGMAPTVAQTPTRLAASVHRGGCAGCLFVDSGCDQSVWAYCLLGLGLLGVRRRGRFSLTLRGHAEPTIRP